MKYILLFLSLYCCSYVYAEWTAETLPSGAGGLSGIDFVNPYFGWAVGSSGEIIATTNGGKVWKIQTSGTSADLLAVQFVNTRKGWAVGYNGVIVATTDGGAHWTPQTSGTTSTIGHVSFVNDSTGFYSLYNVAGAGPHIHKTTNGGKNWVAAYTTSALYEVWSMAAVSPTVLFVGTYDGVWKSTDAGATWIEKGGIQFRYGLGFSSLLHGASVGYEGVTYYTTDAGETWLPSSNSNTSSMYGVEFADDEYGWAAGNSSLVLVTTDGGASWTTEPTASNSGVQPISVVNRGRAWVCGSGVMEYQNSDYQLTAPKTISFVAPSTTFDTTFSITNSGADTLHVTLELNDTMYSVTSTKKFTLKAGAVMPITIHANSQTSGAKNAVLYIESEASADNPPVVISGNFISDVTDVASSNEDDFIGCYPNPFSRLSVVGYRLSVDTQVDLSVFDMFGRKVKTLDEGYKVAGAYSAGVSMDDMPAGVYTYQLRTANKILSKKMIVM